MLFCIYFFASAYLFSITFDISHEISIHAEENTKQNRYVHKRKSEPIVGGIEVCAWHAWDAFSGRQTEEKQSFTSCQSFGIVHTIFNHTTKCLLIALLLFFSACSPSVSLRSCCEYTCICCCCCIRTARGSSNLKHRHSYYMCSAWSIIKKTSKVENLCTYCLQSENKYTQAHIHRSTSLSPSLLSYAMWVLVLKTSGEPKTKKLRQHSKIKLKYVWIASFAFIVSKLTWTDWYRSDSIHE